MCVLSSVSSEKGEAIQLQEDSESIQLQESGKTIQDNYKQQHTKIIRH